MKACPLCKRTYDDETLNFCLADGSLLSDDSDETLTLVAARNTDPGAYTADAFNVTISASPVFIPRKTRR